MKRPSKSTPPRGFKKLACKYCGTVCNRVDVNATAVTCSSCVIKLVNGEVLEPSDAYKKSKK